MICTSGVCRFLKTTFYFDYHLFIIGACSRPSKFIFWGGWFFFVVHAILHLFEKNKYKQLLTTSDCRGTAANVR